MAGNQESPPEAPEERAGVGRGGCGPGLGKHSSGTFLSLKEEAKSTTGGDPAGTDYLRRKVMKEPFRKNAEVRLANTSSCREQ